MVFGAFFGILAGGLIGPGIAWLAILVAAAFANTLNAFLLDEGHRAIGASTAVFAALGLVSGFVWRSKLMAQEKWAWRLGPIVGGIALLAYTGTGGPNTDVGAHLAGFVCGFGGDSSMRLPPPAGGCAQPPLGDHVTPRLEPPDTEARHRLTTARNPSRLHLCCTYCKTPPVIFRGSMP